MKQPLLTGSLDFCRLVLPCTAIALMPVLSNSFANFIDSSTSSNILKKSGKNFELIFNFTSNLSLYRIPYFARNGKWNIFNQIGENFFGIFLVSQQFGAHSEIG